MYDNVCLILIEFVKLLPACVFLRIVLDSFRNFIFKQ